jgi:hypothetical protein
LKDIKDILGIKVKDSKIIEKEKNFEFWEPAVSHGGKFKKG